MDVTCFLLLGSNLGDKLSILNTAEKKISQQIGLVTTKSSIYETQSWGYKDNSSYLNIALEIITSDAVEMVLSKCLKIENDLGRKRITEGYEARAIDIDILFYDKLITNTPNLIIPHPRLHERRFVLEPLNEICPDFIHPKIHQSIKNLLLSCKDKCWVNKL